MSSSDRYEDYYADKLWNLLPAMYRAEDTASFERNGPLREMVNRIGGQAAIIRRSIDRMWEDQSIETCDDWVIPYIADLLATNLVASLDARGQRLDVANTIYYRRRKGTLSLLEEIANDVTGWDARVVEFFRRLARTRHNLDPAIGLPAETDATLDNRALQVAEGLIGTLSNTSIGGWADMRKVYGASKTNSAFDEYFHTADFRRGRAQVGWYNIPNIGVFLWRLYSFPLFVQQDPVMVLTKPVRNSNPLCPAHYTFDPTGRDVALFAASQLHEERYGTKWVSPEEWQLPTPISKPLLELDEAKQLDKEGVVHKLYTSAPSINELNINSVGVFRSNTSNLVAFNDVSINPERGTLTLKSPQARDPQNLLVWSHYGFSSTIGAGAYDRRVLGETVESPPTPTQTRSGGGTVLSAPLATLAPRGTITLQDSLTYTLVSNVGNLATLIDDVAIRAENGQRPVIRLSPSPVTEWVFTSADEGKLTLEGLFVSGCDIVLRGNFASVTISCCTLDPGNAGTLADPSNIFAKSIDGRDLRPCHIWVEGVIRELRVDRSITGPIRTRNDGELESLYITDSIIQSIRTSGFDLFKIEDLKDAGGLSTKLRTSRSPLSSYLRDRVASIPLNRHERHDTPTRFLKNALIRTLNRELQGTELYEAERFDNARLSPLTRQMLPRTLSGSEKIRRNRLLLEDAFPVELADSALALGSGEVKLVRTTVLGPAQVHRLDASECILDDIVMVDDYQHGCVRFSAWSRGSILPRKYESVEVTPNSPLFTSREFGQPGYAQLLQSADSAILSGGQHHSILEGAEDGSEMGAFAREKNPIKERSLRVKYEEFMPLGLFPVIIYVT